MGGSERDTWTATFYADGTSRDVGLTVHIQGPGGIVVRDAGQIVYNADGSLNFIRGPHEQFSGVSFCPALTPVTARGNLRAAACALAGRPRNSRFQSVHAKTA